MATSVRAPLTQLMNTERHLHAERHRTWRAGDVSCAATLRDLEEQVTKDISWLLEDEMSRLEVVFLISISDPREP